VFNYEAIKLQKPPLQGSKPVVCLPTGVMGGAVVALDDGGKSHRVEIKGTTFTPDFLEVEEGAIVEWIVRPAMGVDTPRYVISFDDLPVESDCLKLEEGCNVFREQFTKPGIYAYKC
jgi:plastocyanin